MCLFLLARQRFATVEANYRTTISHKGTFILLLPGLWGADGTQGGKSSRYPGDDNDWKDWDAFLAHLFRDLKANRMTTNLVIDIWNEPDLGDVFWGREQAQYLEMWSRTFQKCR